MLCSGEGDDDRVATGRPVDEHGDVAWRILQERQQPAVLEQSVGCVHEHKLCLLLGSKPRQIFAGRDGREPSGTDVHVASGQFVPTRSQVGRRSRELTSTGDGGREDDLTRARDPGERLGETEERRRTLELQHSDEYDARPRHARASTRRLEIERRIVLKDRMLELLKLCSRLDTELIDKGCTSHSIGGECLGLAATAVESQHL